MKKMKSLRSIISALVLAAVFILPNSLNAQSDGFFRGGESDNYSDRASITVTGTEITLGGAQGENPDPAPLGGGLLIMLAAGAGYVVAKRKRSFRDGATLFLACAMLLTLTQCKKKVVAPETTSEGVHITLTAGYNGDRTVFTPSGDGTTGSFVWTDGVTEYIYVGSATKGWECIGMLSGTGNGSNVLQFEGTLNTEPSDGESMYFFYFGNGTHPNYWNNGSPNTTDPDHARIYFSNQIGNNVTDYHVAISNAVEYKKGKTSYSTTLNMKMAIAKFDLSGFNGEKVYIHGNDVYAKAKINWNSGTIVGEEYGAYYNEGRGYIEVTNPSAETYVAFIPVESDGPSTVKFDSNTKTSSKVFLNGIKAGKYYSNGGATISIAVNNDPLPGTINGLFTVKGTSAGVSTKKVRFSQGNLQYQADPGKWQFADHQYEIKGTDNNNISSTYSGWIDLFGWGTGLNPTNASTNNNDYSSEVDWGTNAISNGGNEANLWRTLSKDEWEWLIGGNKNPGVSCRNCQNRFLKANIEYSNTESRKGLIIFPDDYDNAEITLNNTYVYNNYDGHPSNDTYTVVSKHDWEEMEKVGAVFLPITGIRSGSTYNDQSYTRGFYWTSTNSGSPSAYCLNFYHGTKTGTSCINIVSKYRNNGYSVRLVRDAN